MIDLNLPNAITIGIISILFWIAFKFGMTWLGMGDVSWL